MLRKTLFDVIYQNVNITAHMSPDILSMSYTDNEDGQVDDISITLKMMMENGLETGRLKRVILLI
ncbi:hypothetical protein ECZU20_56800 [Escherichia coli]|nr:hypothetical protein ECZU20_56800 [Escherichia coli]